MWVGVRSDFQEFLQAVGADVLALEDMDVLGVVAENAGGLILLEHDRSPIYIDFQRILLCDVEGTAKLDGQHDAAQFVHTTDDAG